MEKTFSNWFMEYHLSLSVPLNTAIAIPNDIIQGTPGYQIAAHRASLIVPSADLVKTALQHLWHITNPGMAVMVGTYAGVMALGHMRDGKEPYVMLKRFIVDKDFERLWDLQKHRGNVLDSIMPDDVYHAAYQLTLE